MTGDFGRVEAIAAVVVWAAAAAVFLWPGVFVVGEMLNDTLLLTESSYRVAHGQWPGLDFTNALGFMTFLPVAAVFRVTGDLGRSIPIAFTVISAVVLGLAIYIALSRLHRAAGIIITVTAALITLSPFVIGFDTGGKDTVLTTAAMSYNRLGFTLLMLAALLCVEPKARWRARASYSDAVFALMAFALAYYTKLPFGLAIALIVAYWAVLLDPDPVRNKVLPIGVVVIALLVEVLLPGLNAAYIREMRLAQEVVGAVNVRLIVSHGLHALPEILLVAILPMLLLQMTGLLTIGEAVYFLCLLGGSVVLLSQSIQGHYLVTPLAVAAVAATRFERELGDRIQALALAPVLMALLSGALNYAGPALNAIRNHTRHAAGAMTIKNVSPNYAGLRVARVNRLDLLEAAFSGRLDGAQAYAAARWANPRSLVNPLPEDEYAYTLEKLKAASRLCGPSASQSAILDFANVSASLLGYPPVGAYTYAHFGRSFDDAHHLPAERMFGGVDCLFDPKLPQNPDENSGLWAVYGDYVRHHFAASGETKFWRVLVRTTARQ